MSDSDSEDDVPLSARVAALSSKAAAPPPPPPVAAPPPPPAPPKTDKGGGKRKRGAAAAAPPKPKANVSGRAARTGAGGFDLSEAAGDLDADYETLGVLGRGNFAEVNLVRHRTTRVLCALKFCCKLDALSYTHLRQEAQLASKVSHPFILSPLAVSDSPGRAGNFSVLLPLCPGGDILQLLKKQDGHVLSEESARSYGAMIILGLKALHDKNLCYRDLKPENLLLQSNGYIRIADFGFTAPFTQCHKQKVGTIMYLAPELVQKQKHGAPVDWWALGCLLYEFVCGDSPFKREDDDASEAAILAHVAGAPLHVASTDAPASSAEATAAPSASEALTALCGALLNPAQAERLGSAESGGAAALQAHEWFAGFDWDACEAMTTPAPYVPPPLDAEDGDATLLELSSRCQQGFD